MAKLKKGDTIVIHGFVMLKKLTDGSKWVVNKIEKGINGEDFVYCLAKPKANFWHLYTC
jgi:hypothetical protein